MDKQEIELTQSIINITRELQEDRKVERQKNTEHFKWVCLLCGIVMSVLILGMCWMWTTEIKCSYDYSDFTIENKASATISSERSE